MSALGAAMPAMAEAARPNIVLFNIDDLGWSDMSFQGSEFYETPNIDRLRSSSLFFDNGYAAAANSAPSRASMLSGRYAPRHGVYTVGDPARGDAKARKLIPAATKSVLDSSSITILQRLKDVGYTTCHVGKWHVGVDPKDYGADVNIGGTTMGHPNSYFSPYKNPYLEDGPKGEYLIDRLSDEAVGFIESRVESGADNPFFLYYAPYAVHTPLQPKAELAEKYSAKEGNKQHYNVKYAALIESMDCAVGRVMDYLEQSGLIENTVVIFTSDNGGLYSTSKQWPLRAGKGSFYEGGIRVPMLVRWDNVVEPNTTISTPVSQLDIYPTLVDIAQAKVDAEYVLDGESWLRTLRSGRSKLSSRAIYWHFPAYLQSGGPESSDPVFRSRPVSVIRRGDWKLIYNYETGVKELYNLADDISERSDLAESNPKMVDKLYEQLGGWLEQMDAPRDFELNLEYVSYNGK